MFSISGRAYVCKALNEKQSSSLFRTLKSFSESNTWSEKIIDEVVIVFETSVMVDNFCLIRPAVFSLALFLFFKNLLMHDIIVARRLSATIRTLDLTLSVKDRTTSFLLKIEAGVTTSTQPILVRVVRWWWFFSETNLRMQHWNDFIYSVHNLAKWQVRKYDCSA